MRELRKGTWVVAAFVLSVVSLGLAPTEARAAEVVEAKPVEESGGSAVAEPSETVEGAARPAVGAAEDRLGLVLSVKAGGMVATSDLGMSYFLAVDAAYQLPFLQRLFGLGIEVGLSGPGASGVVTSAAAGGEVDYSVAMRILSLAFEATASRSFGELTPYGALGYALFFLHENVDAMGSENSEDQARAGWLVRGGCGYRLGPGDLFAELRYHYVNLRFLTTGKSNAGGMTLDVGYRFFL